MIKEEKSNYDWLLSICGFKPQSWHKEKVIKPDEIENFRFYRRERKHFEGFINPENIKGIDYDFSYNCFNEINWLNLINELKRFESIRRNKKTYKELLDHALNDYKEPKTVAKYGETYITLGGQHRMALCKFLGVKFVKVNVVEHEFDEEKYKSYMDRKSFLDYLLVEKLITLESYENALYQDSIYSSILIKGNHIMIKPNFFNSFIKFYQNLNTNRFLVFLSRLHQLLFGEISSFNNYIESEKDVSRYKNFLRLIKSGQVI